MEKALICMDGTAKELLRVAVTRLGMDRTGDERRGIGKELRSLGNAERSYGNAEQRNARAMRKLHEWPKVQKRDLVLPVRDHHA